MNVRTPPRPPRVDDRRDRSPAEALRDQEALIEEARRRARRRRQRFAALALFGVASIVVIGLARVGGGHPRGAVGASGPLGQAAASRAALAPGNRYSEAPLISADGRVLALDSHASNLVAGDTNGRDDVFVRDRPNGKTTRVSVRTGGEQGSDASYVRAISPDGRYVVFSSYASNLVAGDTDGCNGERLTCSDVFVRDRMSGKTTRVSVSSGGRQANGNSGEAAISANGRFVAFASYASNLVAGDTNKCVQKYPASTAPSANRYPCADVFVRDRVTGKTERVSVSSRDTQANGDSGRRGLAISADGRYVAFDSEASNLVRGDTNKECFSPILRAHYSNDRVQYNCGDVFVHDRVTGTTTRVSVSNGGKQANGTSSEPSISADGRYVAFSSEASNLVASDTNSCGRMNCPDVFVRDRATGTTTRVSVSNGGKQASGASFEPSITADGRHVAFTSYAANLVADDTNTCPTVRQREKFACPDVFVRDRATEKTERVSVSNSGKQANGYSDNPTISADGHIVAFSSAASNLVNGDTNKLRDVFARDRATGTTSLVSIAR